MLVYLLLAVSLLNIGLFCFVLLVLLSLPEAVLTTVETAVSDEVRKQDDRIEKRLQRAERPAEDTSETGDDVIRRAMVGRPLRGRR